MKCIPPYDRFTPLDFSNYDLFLKNIDNQFFNLKKIERKIQTENIVAFEASNLPGEFPNRFSIHFNGINYQCLFDSKKNCDKLFVVFSGARTVKDRIPMFKRQSYYPFIPMNVLHIADPMFEKFPALNLGWYYGNKTQSYIEDIASLILKICKKLRIRNENIFLFGSSGGGYAALQISKYLKDTIHIALNPQIQVREYPGRQTFERITKYSLELEDSLERTNTLDIVSRSENPFLLIFNIDDRHDCEKHLFPLCEKIGLKKINLGLNKNNNFYIWTYKVMGGHNAQGDQFIFSYIAYLAERVKDKRDITPFEDMIFKNVSCLWRLLEWNKHLANLNNVG